MNIPSRLAAFGYPKEGFDHAEVTIHRSCRGFSSINTLGNILKEIHERSSIEFFIYTKFKRVFYFIYLPISYTFSTDYIVFVNEQEILASH